MGQTYSREFLDRLRSEWVGGSGIVFAADPDKNDHPAMNRWILELLDQETRSQEQDYIVNLVYHSLNFDIPFQATASVRADLLQKVRLKLHDTDRN